MYIKDERTSTAEGCGRSASQKKALDEKLHQMVCSGSIELKAAQEEVEKDWVDAYKSTSRSKIPSV